MAKRAKADFVKVGRYALQDEANLIAAREVAESEVPGEFIQEAVARGSRPYVRAVFGGVCVERTSPEEGYADVCESREPYQDIPSLPEGFHALHSFPFDTKIWVKPAAIDDEDLEVAYHSVTGRWPAEDGISEETLREALGMAAKDRARVLVDVSGRLELFADDPLLAKFPVSLQGWRRR